MRSARSRTWAVDSSALAYSTRRPARALCAATSSSSVDLPTPGSPLSRIAAPGTMPPPSTRSNSPTPLVRRGASVVSIEVMGRAARPAPGATGATERVIPTGSDDSTTVPHCWHSPQRPTHLRVVHPHSVHRYGAAVGRRVAMRFSVGEGRDIPRLASPCVAESSRVPREYAWRAWDGPTPHPGSSRPRRSALYAAFTDPAALAVWLPPDRHDRRVRALRRRRRAAATGCA